jgi:methylmalonyl-CoA mutase
MTDSLSLSHGFTPPDYEAWQNLALAALKGAGLEKLTSHTYDKIAIKPLYVAADMPQGIAGEAAPARDVFLPWDIRQTVLNAGVAKANKVALADLEQGVSSIEFVIDPTGQCGIAAQSVGHFKALIEAILLDLASVALTAPSNPLGAAQALHDAIEPPVRSGAKIAFNLDPAGQMMVGGAALSLEQALDFAQACKTDFPAATALRADARPIHEGGGSEAQELAVLIASGLDFLRAGEAIGMGAEDVNQTLLFTLSIGPDVVFETAKLKAARRLWARVLQACGTGRAMKLQAVTSGRMQSIADPWTNILRATCATFAAGIGGADVVTVLPFTSAYEVASEQARRIARNTQLVLQEESHLGRVADPAAGAWAMEALSDDLAKVAWGLVQEIERVGGLKAALACGLVQGWVAATSAARQRDVAKRKTALIGVSVFPNLGENLVMTRPTGEVAPKGSEGGPNSPIPPMRLSAPFEALRAKPNGTIFLATLGPIARFNARSGFAKNAFEAGGIKALGGDDVHADDAATIAAFRQSGAKIACLCGDDATYEARAASLAMGLKLAGATVIWLAGKGAFEGVDRTIFAGADILAELTFAHQVLEGAQ